MKLPLATGVLSSTPPPVPLLRMLRVDRTWDRAEQPRSPHDDLPDSSYRSTPLDALVPRTWEVTIDGEQLSLVNGEHTLRGRETSNVFNERRFELMEGARGRFVMRGDDAELTLFGADLPVVSSERGKLVPR